MTNTNYSRIDPFIVVSKMFSCCYPIGILCNESRYTCLYYLVATFMIFVFLLGDSAKGSGGQEFVSCTGSYSVSRIHEDYAAIYHGHAWYDEQGALPR